MASSPSIRNVARPGSPRAASPRSRAQLYRVSLDGGDPLRVSHEAGTHRAVVAADGEHYVDVVSSRDRPPVTTLRDRSGKTIATIDDARDDPRLATLKLAPPLLAEFKNRDGVTLHGAYYPPRSRALGEKAPLVVMVYGGPHVQTVTESWSMTADLTAQYLAELGFAVWKMEGTGRGFEHGRLEHPRRDADDDEHPQGLPGQASRCGHRLGDCAAMAIIASGELNGTI